MVSVWLLLLLVQKDIVIFWKHGSRSQRTDLPSDILSPCFSSFPRTNERRPIRWESRGGSYIQREKPDTLASLVDVYRIDSTVGQLWRRKNSRGVVYIVFLEEEEEEEDTQMEFLVKEESEEEYLRGQVMAR